MANPLDIGVLHNFSIAFSMILVFAIVYGILAYTKFFGENKSIHAIIAFIVSFFILLSPDLSRVITLMVPWFAVLFIFVVFILIWYRMMGASEEDLNRVLHKNTFVVYMVIILAFIIFLSVLGRVYLSADTASPTGVEVTATNGTVVRGDVGGAPGPSTFWATIFHPKVLGLIFTLLVGVFTIIMLSGSNVPEE